MSCCDYRTWQKSHGIERVVLDNPSVTEVFKSGRSPPIKAAEKRPEVDSASTYLHFNSQ